ncbi:MAG: hypothetical protein ACLF0P_04215 [Thermoanaerobaculia bacterium]
MDTYRPRDATAEAQAIAREHRRLRRAEAAGTFGELRSRRPDPRSLDPSRGKRAVKIDVRGRHEVRFGTTNLALHALEQLVEVAQTRAVARALLVLKERYLDGRTSLAEALGRFEEDLAERGLDLVAGRGKDGGLARPRRFEVAAALNRLRTLRVEPGERLNPTS